MPAALFAPLAKADGSLVVSTDARGTVSYFQRLRLPQRKRVDGSRGPVAAGFAMAVSHCGRLTRPLELHLAPKAAAFVIFSIAHGPLSSVVMGPGFYTPMSATVPCVCTNVQEPQSRTRTAINRQANGGFCSLVL